MQKNSVTEKTTFKTPISHKTPLSTQKKWHVSEVANEKFEKEVEWIFAKARLTFNMLSRILDVCFYLDCPLHVTPVDGLSKQ